MPSDPLLPGQAATLSDSGMPLLPVILFVGLFLLLSTVVLCLLIEDHLRPRRWFGDFRSYRIRTGSTYTTYTPDFVFTITADTSRFQEAFSTMGQSMIDRPTEDL